MKQKILILSLLFFVAVASMHAQDAKMVVKGNLVNVGKFNSSIPVELRETPGNENAITNQAGAEMRVAQLTVDANTKVDNAGNLCVGCDDAYKFETTMKDDRDDQVYRIVNINGVWWMAENLAYEPQATEGGIAYTHSAADSPTPSWTRPGNPQITDEQAKAPIYGGGRMGYLYNWAAAMKIANSGSITSGDPVDRQGICPDGWRIPTDAEWTAMNTYYAANANSFSSSADSLSASHASGGQSATALRSSVKPLNYTGTWSITGTSNAADAANPGFNGLLVGFSYNGIFGQKYGEGAFFWSSTSYFLSGTAAYRRTLYDNFAYVYRTEYNKSQAQYSVRCVK